MSLALILLIVFILLAAFVPMDAKLKQGLWIGAAICLVILLLQVFGVIGGGPVIIR